MASTELRAAAQQALEALTNCTSEYGHRCNRCDSEVDEGGKAVEALRAALAEPVQEPDSPERRCGGPGCDMKCCQPVAQRGAMFHTHPAVERQRSVEAAVRPACGVDPAAKAETVQEPVADRAAFERHAERLGYSVDPDTREGREGGYWSSHTQLMWLTWQAAMAQRPAEPVQETEMRRCPRCWEPMFPPQRKPLTDDAMQKVFTDSFGLCPEPGGFLFRVGRAVERAHKIGGEG